MIADRHSQLDLFGNVVPLEDERVLIYVSAYTRDLMRKLRATTANDILDLTETAAKILIALSDVIEKDDLAAIQSSKDKVEIREILQTALSILSGI